MEENNTPFKQGKVEEAGSDSSPAFSVSTDDILSRAEASAKRMEEANLKAEELLKRQEQIAARLILSGKSEAGITPVQKSDEEIKKEQLKIYWKGSAIENYLK